MGIDPEHLAHIFSRFGAAHTTSQSQGGLGLGLAIVHHLVGLHGGTVRAESAGPGEGATFTVTLPLTDARASDPSQARRTEVTPTASAPATLAGVRVLVVDDVAESRELLRAILEECGAEVTDAGSVQAALRTLEQAPFDVLISDIAMPGDDGYALIRRVRSLPAEHGGQIPAVALTAYARIEDRAAALEAGYHQHAAKPIEPSELSALVAVLAGRTASEPCP